MSQPLSGNILRALRQQSGRTIIDVEKITSFDKVFLSRVERNQENVTLAQARELAIAYGLQPPTDERIISLDWEVKPHGKIQL